MTLSNTFSLKEKETSLRIKAKTTFLRQRPERENRSTEPMESMNAVDTILVGNAPMESTTLKSWPWKSKASGLKRKKRFRSLAFPFGLKHQEVEVFKGRLGLIKPLGPLKGDRYSSSNSWRSSSIAWLVNHCSLGYLTDPQCTLRP